MSKGTYLLLCMYGIQGVFQTTERTHRSTPTLTTIFSLTLGTDCNSTSVPASQRRWVKAWWLKKSGQVAYLHVVYGALGLPVPPGNDLFIQAFCGCPGVLANTPDSKPLVGVARKRADDALRGAIVLVGVGFNGNGMSQCFGAGKALGMQRVVTERR